MARIPRGIDKATLELISDILDGVVSRACTRHYEAETQEHQFTAKLAGALEDGLQDVDANGFEMDVRFQDFSDRGPISKEKTTGADLYVSVVLQSGNINVSKGMLVQSKWDQDVRLPNMALQTQVDKMKQRSSSSYVWIYEPSGIRVIPAAGIVRGKIDYGEARTVGQTIANGLRCTEGDRKIGRRLMLPPVRSLNEIMSKLADRGLSLTARAR